MSINFACKRIRREDLIKCAFDINKTSYKILFFLMKKSGNDLSSEDSKKKTVSEIANKVNLQRSSVQKALKELLNKDLIKRSQMNLEKGGYIYFYYSIDKNEIKKRISALLEEWHTNARKEINNL